jgi:hypothetical protein
VEKPQGRRAGATLQFAERPHKTKNGDPKNQFPTGRKFEKYIGQNALVLGEFLAFSLDFWTFHERLDYGG